MEHEKEAFDAHAFLDLLAEVVLREDTEHSREEVLAALQRVQLSDQHQRTDRLRARIRELEREGKREEAIQLMAELPRLTAAARNRG